ncbi:MAG: signal peptidase II [Gammaproteobacteria bacterium]
MEAKPFPRLLWEKLPWLVVFAVGFGYDQWTKRWIIANFQERQIQPVTDWFNLTRLHNEGAAFSFLANAGGWQKHFFITLALVVSAVVAIWLWRLPTRNHKLLSGGLALILSGALGNAIDRLLYGHVVDFLDVYYQTYHWPAFNVADSCIFVGAFLVILDVFVNGDRDADSQ